MLGKGIDVGDGRGSCPTDDGKNISVECSSGCNNNIEITEVVSNAIAHCGCVLTGGGEMIWHKL